MVAHTLTLCLPPLQCCAVAFIEKLDAQSLNLSSEDFERYMSGQASPSGPDSGHGWASGAAGASPGVVQTQLETLSGLSQRQEQVRNKQAYKTPTTAVTVSTDKSLLAYKTLTSAVTVSTDKSLLAYKTPATAQLALIKAY